MRFVLDTATLVAAFRSNRGASNRLLVAILEGRATLLVSTPLLLEYEAVLTRSSHVTASGLSVEEINLVLDSLAAKAEAVRLVYLWRPTLRDPDDDMVLETAVNGRADALVTFNKRDFINVAPQFGLAVLSPGEAVQRMEAHR